MRTILRVLRAAFVAAGLALLGARGTIASAAAAAPAAVATHDSTSFERGTLAYLDFRFEDARRLFDSALAETGDDARTHAWLGFTWFRLQQVDKAWHEAHVALALDSCSTVAWEVLNRCLNPQFGEWDRSNADSAWTCLLRGVRCDSLDGNLWESVWIGALERDPPLAARALRGLRESGLFGVPLFANARWMLSDVPPRAVLIANGDADLYPMLVVQQAEQLRPDVALVNLSLLSLPWYRRYVRDSLRVTMPFDPMHLDTLGWQPDSSGWIPPSRTVVRGWLDMRGAGRLDRPLAMAISVSASEVPATVRLEGATWLLDPAYAAGEVDTAAIRRGVVRLRRSDLAGAAVSPASRSPYLRDARWIARNVGSAIACHYVACRHAGATRQAEELRAFGMALLQGSAFSEVSRDLRSLPDRWQTQTWRPAR